MKLNALGLLGLVAFASAYTTELNLFASVPEVQLIEYEAIPQGVAFPPYVEDYFKNIIDQMNVVLAAFKSVVSDDKQEIELAAQAVQMDAMSKIDAILKKVQELMAKGGKIGQCAVKEEAAIMEITELVGEGIKVCAQDMIIALKDLTGGIMGQSNDLLASIQALKDIVAYCMSKGKLGQAFCITTNLTKGLRLVKKIIADAKVILATLQEKSANLIAAAKDCNNNHIQVIFGKVKDVKNNVEICTKNN